jgi:hypothetical protein
MPRYFFHVYSSNGVARDKAGQDLPDAEAAKTEALRALQEMHGAKAEKVASQSLLIEIADEAGTTVANVPLPAGERFPSGHGPEDDEDNNLA